MSDSTSGRIWLIPLILIGVVSFGVAHDMNLTATAGHGEVAHAQEAEAGPVPHVETVCAMVLAAFTLLGLALTLLCRQQRYSTLAPCVSPSRRHRVHFLDLSPPRMRSYDFCPILA